MYYSMPDYFAPRLSHCEIIRVEEEDLDTEFLHVRTTSNETKHTLLSQHPRPSPSEAGSLLAELTRLVPSLAKSFQPKPTAVNRFPFRLINDIDQVEKDCSYVAISYCTKKIKREVSRKETSAVDELPFGWLKEVQEFPLPTSRSMFQAVLEERDIGEGLWYDQVCIDPDDEAERANTIGAIDTIYANARAVIVALDDVVATRHEADFLRQYFDYYTHSTLPIHQHPSKGLAPPFMQSQPAFRSFIERIVSSDWFGRAWCALEMKMGQSHVFLVPCERYGEDEESLFVRFTGEFFFHMLVLSSEVSASNPIIEIRKRSLLRFFVGRAVQQHDSASGKTSTPKKPPGLERVSLVPSISEAFSLKASGNPLFPSYFRRLDANRDKTSIALGIAGIPLSLMPSFPLQRPTIEDECIRQLLLISLAARDPAALCTAGMPLKLHDGSISWLCRPTPLDSQAGGPALPPTSEHSISIGSDGGAEYVQMALVFLDLPHRTALDSSFSQHVQRATMFIDLCIQHSIPGPSIWTTWQNVNHARAASMKNVFVQTLACAFDCGPDWISDISQQILDKGKGLGRGLVEVICNPMLLLQNFLSIAEGRHASTVLINFLATIIARGLPWASGATERTFGPLIITSPSRATASNHSSPVLSDTDPSSTFRSPPTHGVPANERAIIFAPFTHSKTLLVAIPAAVKSTEYTSLARGWILTPRNCFTGSPRTSVDWTLQSKAPIFGDQAFKASVASCEGKSGHRVFGPNAEV